MDISILTKLRCSIIKFKKVTNKNFKLEHIKGSLYEKIMVKYLTETNVKLIFGIVKTTVKLKPM